MCDSGSSPRTHILFLSHSRPKPPSSLGPLSSAEYTVVNFVNIVRKLFMSKLNQQYFVHFKLSFNRILYFTASADQTRKIVLPKLFWPTVREKFEIRGWRTRFCKIFEITRTIYSNSERSEQLLVTECFFNLFLDVSHI